MFCLVGHKNEIALVFLCESASVRHMPNTTQNFDSIRPYNDDEVSKIVAEVLANEDLAKAACHLVMPKILHNTWLGEVLTRRLLKLRTSRLNSVQDVQTFLAQYFAKLVNTTCDDLTFSGMENLSSDKAYLFISNHRDIVLDSSLLNFGLYNHGLDTCRQAVGDNLLRNKLTADLMRLNKSFVVERSVSGAKAMLKALNKTSAYVRHSLEEQASVWIAQKEGRAKDGWDRTDPALLKMLALAHRDEDDALNALFDRCDILPVSVSYELDPCAGLKAHELSVVATHGQYDKAAEEDVRSIVVGLTGNKGRVHIHISAPVKGPFESPEAAAAAIDAKIVGGLRVFPTHVEACKRKGLKDNCVSPEAAVPINEKVMRRFIKQLRKTPLAERPFLLDQYANLVCNQQALTNAQDNQDPSK